VHTVENSSTAIVHGDALSPDQTAPHRLKAAISGASASAITWFDFYLYPTYSVFLADAFFPAGRRRLLDTAAIFAAGFLMRPLGSWLIGIYADRSGRRAALIASVVLTCLGCLAIAACPGYARIGMLAPAVLILVQLLQGLALGGSYGTSAAYLSETASPGLRGFYSSFTFVSIILGQLFATLTLLVVEHLPLTGPQLAAWGWRLPFLIGAGLAATGLPLRRSLAETDAFKAQAGQRHGDSPMRELLRHKREALLAVGITIGGTLAFYTFTVDVPEALTPIARLPRPEAALVTFAALFLFMLLQPLFALLSDRIGRRPLLLWFGVTGVVFTCIS
jgi:MFS transporter, MHS family, alpha-ketoglutarate permease